MSMTERDLTKMFEEEGVPEPADTPQAPPPAPSTVEETGLSEGEIIDLLLKALYDLGTRTGEELADFVALPYAILDDLLLTVQQRHFVEVLGTTGHGRAGYSFSLTDEGRARARGAMERNRYVGSAPVTLAYFREWVQKQSIRHNRVTHEALRAGFQDLVLPDEVFDALGPAINSGSSIFLHGAPGNGKTAIAERLGQLTSTSIYLPRAITIDGHVIVIFDPVYHRLVDGGSTDDASALVKSTTLDRRFVHVRRPVVFVGGELTMDQLDLRYDPHSKVYQAPFQLKASGGVLIVDDFGRQRMRPAELLNRWIVPLEKEFDNLSLHSGLKFPVPFDCLLVFATNLNPRDLVDEAFLRRIQFKVEVRSPDRDAFTDILRMNCRERDIEYDAAAVELLFHDYYDAMGFPPRGCHPRDILHQIQSVASFRNTTPKLDAESVHRAARSYFLVMEEDYVAGIPSITAKREHP